MSTSLVDPQDRRPRVGAILIASFIGFLVGEILALVLVVVGVWFTHYHGGVLALSKVSAPPSWANALGLVGLWVGFAGAIYYARHEGRLADLPGQWSVRVSDLGYVVVGVVAQFAVDAAYAPFHFRSLNQPVHHLFASAHGPGFVLVALMTTFLAPFFEEWFFRGVVYRSIAEGSLWRPSRASVVLGVASSAVLFALAHAEPLQFAGLAALGVVLALLVQRTQRLVPSYVTHASFNATALVALMVARGGHG